MTNTPQRQMEIWISNILRLGVLLSLATVVLGTTVSFLHHPQYMDDSPALKTLTTPGAAFPHTLRDVGLALLQGRGQAIVMLGLILLIATPVLRVAASVVGFAIERDVRYVIITAIVLTVLILSFFLGGAG